MAKLKNLVFCSNCKKVTLAEEFDRHSCLPMRSRPRQAMPYFLPPRKDATVIANLVFCSKCKKVTIAEEFDHHVCPPPMSQVGRRAVPYIPSQIIRTPQFKGQYLEQLPAPFRDYTEFLSRTLNSQHFKVVHAYDSMDQDAIRSWFYYQCYRSPNQFTGKIDLEKALTFLIGGIKGGGKSQLVAALAAFFRKWIGAYGSGDDEILADLRAYEYADKVPSKIGKSLEEKERGLIIGAPSVTVRSSYDYISYDKLTLNDLYNHDVIVCPQRIFPSKKSFFNATESLVEVVEQRPFADDVWAMKILEAANVIYSRITVKSAKLDQAKAHLIWLMREMRHYGITMALDTQYLTSIDREMRVNSDYFMLKNMGSDRLPNDISWMYRYVSPIGFMSLYQNEFVAKDKYGGVYLGWNMAPPWRKEPKENIYKTMDIIPEYDAEGLSSELKDTGQEEFDIALHMEIVTTYAEIQSIKGTVRKLGEKGTPHDRDTVRKHVAMHFEAKTCSCHKSATPKPEELKSSTVVHVTDPALIAALEDAQREEEEQDIGGLKVRMEETIIQAKTAVASADQRTLMNSVMEAGEILNLVEKDDSEIGNAVRAMWKEFDHWKVSEEQAEKILE